ncbi:MAG: hypothetical protein HeimC3_11500 [Candidatus Heimdallarchaeota archaeon LC_3]|nr:MAG: hypothetical protein HeimC3_11500 [Candidatus Heimdallarchaeota archaeon LC_3]
MDKKDFLIFATYSFLLILYALSIRIFTYGIEIRDIFIKQQFVNFSGLILLLALVLTFNIFLIKGIFDINKINSVKNEIGITKVI